MAYGSVNCPQCGLKSNVRATSVGTMRRCQNCGHKFIIAEPPLSQRFGSCLGSLLGLVVVASVLVLVCCGGVGWIASRSETPSVSPPTSLSREDRTSQPINPPSEIRPASPGIPAEVPANGVEVPEQPESIIRELDPVPAPQAPSSSRVRTWTSADGKFSTEAEFGGMAFGKVKLRKADGTIVTVDSAKLSDEDQEWIKKRAHP